MREVYAAHHKNQEILRESASGGIFTACSDYIFQNGGTVVAARYDYETQKLEHAIAATPGERDTMRGSMYFQSAVRKEIYAYVEEQMKARQPVLFVGTPCQVGAMKNYLAVKKADTGCLYTVDILCHGVGSPGIWTRFSEMIRKLHRGKLTRISFKDKRKGWLDPLCIGAIGKKEVSLRGFSWLYFSDSIMRPCCHNCRYASFDRPGDISVGDYWSARQKAPDAFHPMGTSVVLVNSEKGACMLEQVRDLVHLVESTPQDCAQPNLEHPTPSGKHREAVMKDFSRKATAFFFLKWSVVLLTEKLWQKARKIWKRIGGRA